MRAGFKCALVVSAVLLIQTPVASANTAVSLLSGGNLDVQADATGTNITVAMTGAATVTVDRPSRQRDRQRAQLHAGGPGRHGDVPERDAGINGVGKDGDDTIAVAPGHRARLPPLRQQRTDTSTGGDYRRLQGGDGNDTLNGGAGNDYPQVGVGSDHVNGGGGNDRVSREAGACPVTSTCSTARPTTTSSGARATGPRSTTAGRRRPVPALQLRASRGS